MDATHAPVCQLFILLTNFVADKFLLSARNAVVVCGFSFLLAAASARSLKRNHPHKVANAFPPDLVTGFSVIEIVLRRLLDNKLLSMG